MDNSPARIRYCANLGDASASVERRRIAIPPIEIATSTAGMNDVPVIPCVTRLSIENAVRGYGAVPRIAGQWIVNSRPAPPIALTGEMQVRAASSARLFDEVNVSATVVAGPLADEAYFSPCTESQITAAIAAIAPKRRSPPAVSSRPSAHARHASDTRP